MFSKIYIALIRLVLYSFCFLIYFDFWIFIREPKTSLFFIRYNIWWSIYFMKNIWSGVMLKTLVAYKDRESITFQILIQSLNCYAMLCYEFINKFRVRVFLNKNPATNLLYFLLIFENLKWYRKGGTVTHSIYLYLQNTTFQTNQQPKTWWRIVNWASSKWFKISSNKEMEKDGRQIVRNQLRIVKGDGIVFCICKFLT